MYLQSQYGKQKYWDSLIQAVQSASPPYAAALFGIKARGGIIRQKYFDIISGAPSNQRGQISSQEILTRLVKAEVLKPIETSGFGRCLMLSDIDEDETSLLSHLRARSQVEVIVLDEIVRWANRLNISSTNTIMSREGTSLPTFGTHSFDLCGPSYLRPLIKYRSEKLLPGFFVADVILGQELGMEYVTPFLRKCTTLSYLKGIRPFLPMLIAESFTIEALHACREQGVMATTPSALFGNNAGKALAELIKTLENAAIVAATDPEKIEKLLCSLSAIEGEAGNIRGALFELVVGHMVRSVEGGSIDIGLVVHDVEQNKKAEIDVFLCKERTINVYECKGYQQTSIINLEEISSWVKDKIPVIYNALKREARFAHSNYRFEYWTTGTFSSEAETFLKEHSSKTKRYKIGWADGKSVLEYSNQIQAPGVKKMLKEHYLYAPITRIVANNRS